MKERLQNYITDIEQVVEKEFTSKERETLIQELLIQIGFFQHERLIHLLVTIFVGLLLLGCLLFTIFLPNLGTLILGTIFFILEVPYIFHYFRLENGVQYLYQLYDRLKSKK